MSGVDRPKLETIVHEITHWSDQVSSVWGQDYLVNLFNAYEAANANHEDQFFKVLEQYDEERRILFPHYYHVQEKNARPHDKNKPWQIGFSAGQEFNADGFINPARPIFFVKFGDNVTNELVARQPITIGSLLETTATWAELRAGLATLRLIPSDERTVETSLWTGERLKALYEPSLTVYTAPVHMLARFANTTDLLHAYERGAILANVVLNLSGEHFDCLKHPDNFAPFGDRQAAFARARDRGYAFAVLACHASKIDFDQPSRKWQAEVLQRAGLPSYENILHDAYAHLNNLGRGLPIRSALDQVRDYLLEIGRERFLSRAATNFTSDMFDPIGGTDGPMPPMFDRDANLFYIGSKPLDPKHFDPEAMHSQEWQLRKFTDNFLQGCRGMGIIP